MPKADDDSLAQDPADTATAPDAFDCQPSENCVEYFLFLLGAETVAPERLLELEALREAAVELAQTLTKDYIWQHDDFQLDLKTDKGLQYLHGVTDYGDAVEDEWLIVYMLRELTKSHPNLWVRLVDSDGEFLLVEAANALPRWLSPEMDQNRAWVHGGKLLIIPPDDHGAQPTWPRSLSLPQAVEFIKSEPDRLVHSAAVQMEAFYRLNKYPGQVADSTHHSLLTIPRKLAFILHSLPQSVSPAVEAFYLRTPVDLKPFLSSRPLNFPPEDLVTTSVRFSRVLFAQLRSQRFEPPPGWWQIVRPASSSSPPDDRSTARLEMGVKLTCGFEMLAVHADKSKNRVVRQVASMLQDLVEDGDAALPTDQEIESWQDCRRDDDESWMDINYEDFELELDGKRPHGAHMTDSGFGDAQTQADLRKIVSRFEAFLNDENAGPDGAELDGTDMDSGGGDEETEGESEEESSEVEDKEVTFDEQVFSRMVREMTGLPSTHCPQPPDTDGKRETQARTGEAETSALNEEDSQIQVLSLQMETELRRHGALKLDTTTDRRLASEDKGQGTDTEQQQTHQGSNDTQVADGDSNCEVEIDYNLAFNLLESFKSQAGMAGPTGNLLGMMGFRLPRDEDDEDNDGEQSKVSETT